MSGSGSFRTAMLAGGALAATLFGASFAGAQEGPHTPVNFEDPAARLDERPALDLSIRDDTSARFAPASTEVQSGAQRPRRLELELAAGGGDSPVDVSIAQRASFGANENGDIDRRGSGSELRIGRGLVQDGRDRGTGSSVYMFVASDDEALTWQPGARTDFGGRSSSLALEGDRVNVGDRSAGVTYERNGVQASLAYVEREEATQVGLQSFTQEQAFTGVTLTMRH